MLTITNQLNGEYERASAQDGTTYLFAFKQEDLN